MQNIHTVSALPKIYKQNEKTTDKAQEGIIAYIKSEKMYDFILNTSFDLMAFCIPKNGMVYKTAYANVKGKIHIIAETFI